MQSRRPASERQRDDAERGPAPPALGGISVVMIQAISSAHWLAVAMIARLRPPEISGITMASASRPSSRQLEHHRLQRAERREAFRHEEREEARAAPTSSAEQSPPALAGAEAASQAAEAGRSAGRGSAMGGRLAGRGGGGRGAS